MAKVLILQQKRF